MFLVTFRRYVWIQTCSSFLKPSNHLIEELNVLFCAKAKMILLKIVEGIRWYNAGKSFYYLKSKKSHLPNACHSFMRWLWIAAQWTKYPKHSEHTEHTPFTLLCVLFNANANYNYNFPRRLLHLYLYFYFIITITIDWMEYAEHANLCNTSISLTPFD